MEAFIIAGYFVGAFVVAFVAVYALGGKKVRDQIRSEW
jgi:hypothetical protein